MTHQARSLSLSVFAEAISSHLLRKVTSFSFILSGHFIFVICESVNFICGFAGAKKAINRKLLFSSLISLSASQCVTLYYWLGGLINADLEIKLLRLK